MDERTPVEPETVRRLNRGRFLGVAGLGPALVFSAHVASAGFGLDPRSVAVALALILASGLGAAFLWSWAGRRLGPKHALDLASLTALLALFLMAVGPALGLAPASFYPMGIVAMAALAGLVVLDGPLIAPIRSMSRAPTTPPVLLAGALGAGSALWALLLFAFGASPAIPAALGGVAMVTALVLLRPVPDSLRPGPTPLHTWLPWRRPDGRPEPLPPGWWTRLPAHLTYALVTSTLFLVYARTYGRIPTQLVEAFVYRIPRLFSDPPQTLLNLVTGIWVNYHPVQLLYVLVLLAVFGIWFEIREGSRRAILVFYGTSVAGAVAAGLLLHLANALSDAAWIEAAWDRPWVGGSAGAFGLMGAYAARARNPWPLLGLFLLWEINVEVWHLKSYTPAFHLGALATGFWMTRRWLRPLGGPGAPSV